MNIEFSGQLRFESRDQTAVLQKVWFHAGCRFLTF
jgi:hypothetical protein